MAIIRVKDNNGTVTDIPAFVGPRGETGVGIASIKRTSGTGAPGTTDTYTITFTDSSVTTYQVYNGKDGNNGANGEAGPSGTSVSVSEINESAEDGGTNVVTFSDGSILTIKNGTKGNTGDKGETGDRGLQGEQGIQGEKGETGATGAAGKDGVSVTKTEINNKGELVITLSDNTVSNLGIVVGAKGDQGEQGIQGEKGDKGDKGEQGIQGDRGNPGVPGYTPVLGIDYWTDEDRYTINANIAEELSKRSQLKPEFANSIDECTDTTKLYVLPDGNIYAYTTKWISEKNNEFNPDTAQLNRRISSSGEEKDYVGILLLPLTNVTTGSPYKVKITGVTLNPGYDTYLIVNYYSGSRRLGFYNYDNINKFVKFDDKDYEIDLYNETYVGDGYDGVRLQLGIKTELSITADDVKDLVVEFVPKNIDEYVSSWDDTGHAFVPADYEDRIIMVEQQSAENAQKLASLNSNDSIVIPSYWQESVDAVVDKVKALQDAGGSDVVNFVWFSDMHHTNGIAYTQNIGSLCAKIMNACNVPITISSGDTASASVAVSENQFLGWITDATKVLSPISTERLLIARGNHDDVYGKNNGVDYASKVSSKKVWNILHRPYAMDFRRVYGPEGTYFYLDNVPQKTRFIILDSHRYTGDGYTNETKHAMTNGYGQTQMSWFANEALPKDKADWSVVIVQHVPPTAKAVNGVTTYLSDISGGEVFRGVVTAYCNKSSYSGSYSGTEYNTIDGISVDYSATQTSDILGIFCGHCHADACVIGDLPCPIVTVTCAGRPPYDGTDAERVSGTDKETAIDIVSINKNTGYIHITRLGAGNDRSCKYKEVQT